MTNSNGSKRILGSRSRVIVGLLRGDYEQMACDHFDRAEAGSLTPEALEALLEVFLKRDDVCRTEKILNALAECLTVDRLFALAKNARKKKSGRLFSALVKRLPPGKPRDALIKSVLGKGSSASEISLSTKDMVTLASLVASKRFAARWLESRATFFLQDKRYREWQHLVMALGREIRLDELAQVCGSDFAPDLDFLKRVPASPHRTRLVREHIAQLIGKGDYNGANSVADTFGQTLNGRDVAEAKETLIARCDFDSLSQVLRDHFEGAFSDKLVEDFVASCVKHKRVDVIAKVVADISRPVKLRLLFARVLVVYATGLDQDAVDGSLRSIVHDECVPPMIRKLVARACLSSLVFNGHALVAQDTARVLGRRLTVDEIEGLVVAFAMQKRYEEALQLSEDHELEIPDDLLELLIKRM